MDSQRMDGQRMDGQRMALDFVNPIVDILYGILAMSKAVYSYGLESAGLMDITDEISVLLDIPVDAVINPDNDALEKEIEELRDQIESDAHECAVEIARAVEHKLKGKYLESKEDVAECMSSLSHKEIEVLYKELCCNLGIHSQKNASDCTAIAILDYVEGFSDNKEDLLNVFSL